MLNPAFVFRQARAEHPRVLNLLMVSLGSTDDKAQINMTIFDFVTQEELDDLDEDPQIAFMTLVNHAQRRLAEQTRVLNLEDRSDWEYRDELRHSFMNIVVAAGKRFEISPFNKIEIPRLDDFKNHDHNQFKADLEHYITQILIDNSVRSKRNSVEILPNSKDRIRTYVNGLRTCIEQAHMTDAKREVLLKRLDEFEKELEKRRLNILAISRIVFEILAIPGGVWSSAEVAHRLVTQVMQTFAEAKAAENEVKQITSSTAPKALSPPRSAEPPMINRHIEDDIPF